MPRSAAKTGAKTPRKPRAPKTHQLADPVPENTVFRDMMKKEWRSGPPVGSGGFGLIYLADVETGRKVGQDANYVLKVEPHDNGPLFCELNFYMRAAKPEMVQEWKSQHKLKQLGMPLYIASGSHERDHTKYRFMVMERFSTDLQKLFEQNKKHFPPETVFSLGIQMLDVLQYIHEHDYAHGDIKASNMLLGFQKSVANQCYLVDYGLAFRYMINGRHKEYHEDPKRKHDGTIEFTSRDAHRGVAPSRRGDLEILGYCMVQWMCGKLPWEDKLSNKDYVAAQKEKYMGDIKLFMKTCFPNNEPPAIREYLEYVVQLDYEEEPDYTSLKRIFRDALKKLGFKEGSQLQFGRPASPKKRQSDFGSPQVRKKPSRASSPAKGRRTPQTPGKSPARKGTPKRLATPVAANGDGSDIIPGLGESATSRGHRGRLSGEDIIPGLNKVGGCTVEKKKGKTYTIKRHRGVKEVMTVATQTSPGLRGLKHKRKK